MMQTGGSDWDVSYSFKNGFRDTRFSNDFCDDDDIINCNGGTQTGQLLTLFHDTRANGKCKSSRVTFSNGVPTTSPSPSPPRPSSSSSFIGNGGASTSFIEHHVSKHDTLAGVAIKYGVEVADIKKLNGLVTDLQMFALKTLQIPLPGRHPPSPWISNGSDSTGQNNNEQTSSGQAQSDLFGSFQSLRPRSKSSQRKVSPAMDFLRGYYQLKPTEPKIASEGFEMTFYGKGGSDSMEDGYLTPAPSSERPLSSHHKSRSLVNGFLDAANSGSADGDSERGSEKLCRRRQKSVNDFRSNCSEMLVREENNSGAAFSAITGKGLALRPKAASKTALPTDAEAGGSSPVSVGDSLGSDGYSMVRKSSSTPSLQDQDNSNSILRSSKWSLKPDLQAALSAAAITRPIFDGLPRPATVRRNKAALD